MIHYNLIHFLQLEFEFDYLFIYLFIYLLLNFIVYKQKLFFKKKKKN